MTHRELLKDVADNPDAGSLRTARYVTRNTSGATGIDWNFSNVMLDTGSLTSSHSIFSFVKIHPELPNSMKSSDRRSETISLFLRIPELSNSSSSSCSFFATSSPSVSSIFSPHSVTPIQHATKKAHKFPQWSDPYTYANPIVVCDHALDTTQCSSYSQVMQICPLHRHHHHHSHVANVSAAHSEQIS